MKERPILFSGPMVLALLDGTKTQTRRVIKSTGLYAIDAAIHGQETAARELLALATGCPYGQPGDQLWVRETFQPIFAPDIEHGAADWGTGEGYQPRYVATDERVEWIDADDNITDRCKPAIHMPRWASRITLAVTGVRVERLQDINEADARAEGLTCKNGLYGTPGQVWQIDPRKAYRDLWESINGPDSWTANPWVWCIEFQRVQP